MTDVSRVRKFAGAFFLIGASLLSGCASLGPGLDPQAFSELPKRVEIPDVPFHAQEKHQCGPASLAMALNWSGVSVTPDDLVPQVYSPDRKGTFQVEMMGAVRRYGHLAFPINGLNALLEELAADHPVIVLQNLSLDWAPAWHYALVLGYDLESESIIMHSGMTRRYVVDWTVFIRTWERGSFWGLLVLPPGILPASVSEEAYLYAVFSLEQVEMWTAASVAYETALDRWPDSVAALMGAGNSYYALGDLTKAEDAFRRAVNIAPGHGATHNNLAHVLAEQGRYEAALESIARAIQVGGAQKPLFEQTLREIKAKMSQVEQKEFH